MLRSLIAGVRALLRVIAECQPRHRHKEFLRFLRRIDQSADPELDIHMVLDNYGTHKHPEVKKWLAARPRCHLHFTPTSSSWLNQIERWFAEITRKRIRRGLFAVCVIWSAPFRTTSASTTATHSPSIG